MGLNVIMMGAPGAGKGTQADRFARERGLPKISTGDMLREGIKEQNPVALEAKKLMDRFKWWEYYCRVLGAEMDNNPAPGNKAGGLTTVFEKSLGGVTKGGTTPLMDVFCYGEPITTRGFVFMDTPGHDPVSITGLVVSRW